MTTLRRSESEREWRIRRLGETLSEQDAKDHLRALDGLREKFDPAECAICAAIERKGFGRNEGDQAKDWPNEGSPA